MMTDGDGRLELMIGVESFMRDVTLTRVSH